MAFQKYTLWNSRVWNSGLQDMNSIIFKIKVDSALAETVVFIWIFNNWFLEEGTEIKNLKMKVRNGFLLY